ncbi:helix-turn-helix domain-containing protein [Chachezhania antarctica]|uniref:helix-turn-helix domain-containing protein n=1 Tax=Chachezhania antarctica TaxID=2340860 RepID=UPI000EB5347C|nr:XRE family transcriptional regulator [Chachezhania antarctica]
MTGAQDNVETRRAAFGNRVQRLRKSQNLTLQQVSDASGLAMSTISKIERSHLSPTYDVMLKLSRGLGTDLVHLLDSDDAVEPRPVAAGRMAVTRVQDLRPMDSGPYIYEPLATQLKNRLIDATYVTVTARSADAFDEPIRHEGEELVVVISGSVELHTDLYEPITLNAGDSVYYDAAMSHQYVTVSDEDARILNIATGNNMRRPGKG